jgi:hypothetical protein
MQNHRARDYDVLVAKPKVIAAVIVVGALLGVVVAITSMQITTPSGKPRQMRVAPAAGATTSRTADAAWHERFDAVYKLAPGEGIKIVPPPWIAERLPFHRDRISENNTTGAIALLIEQQRNGSLHVASSLVGLPGVTDGGYSVGDALADIVGIPAEEVDLPAALLKTQVRGDWVYRNDLPPELRLAALMKVIAPLAGGRTYELVRRPQEREVIVVSGKFKFQPLPGATDDEGKPAIHLFVRDGEPATMPSGVGGGAAGIRTVLKQLSEITGYPVVFDTPLTNDMRVSWRQQESVVQMEEKRTGPADAAEVDALLVNVAKQTSLELKRGRRTVEMWAPKE